MKELVIERMFCDRTIWMELIVKKAKTPGSEKEIYQNSILKDIDKFNQRIRNIQEQLSDKEFLLKTIMR